MHDNGCWTYNRAQPITVEDHSNKFSRLLKPVKIPVQSRTSPCRLALHFCRMYCTAAAIISGVNGDDPSVA